MNKKQFHRHHSTDCRILNRCTMVEVNQRVVEKVHWIMTKLHRLSTVWCTLQKQTRESLSRGKKRERRKRHSTCTNLIIEAGNDSASETRAQRLLLNFSPIRARRSRYITQRSPSGKVPICSSLSFSLSISLSAALFFSVSHSPVERNCSTKPAVCVTIAIRKAERIDFRFRNHHRSGI